MRLAAGLGVVLAACSVQVDVGPGFRCEEGVACPAGQTCIDGHCRFGAPPDGSPLDDAGDQPDSVPPPDARLIDAPPGIDPPWWDEAWGMRRELTVSNGSASTLPVGFEVRWFVDLDVYDASPFHQARIVRWDGTSWSEKTRVLDDPPAATPVEEQLFFDLDEALAASASTSQYWLYWDNPAAGPAPSSAADVFSLFYDDFDLFDLGSWARTSTSVAAAGGFLVLDPQESARSLTTWGPGHALDVKLRFSAPAAFSWVGFQRAGDFMDQEPWILWVDWDGGSVAPDSLIVAVGDSASVTGPTRTPGTLDHIYTIERFPDRLSYVYDGATHDARTLPATFATPLQIRFRNGSGSSTLFLDYARLRRVVDPEPTITVDVEQARP